MLSFGVAAGCVSVQQGLDWHGGCSIAPVPVEGVLRIATDRLVNGQTTFSKELRAAARVPPQEDSIRAHARVIDDDRVCREVGKSADAWRLGDIYAVVQIGNSFWVRGSSWRYIKVLTTGYTIVGRIAD